MINRITALVDNFVDWLWVRKRNHILDLVSDDKRYIAEMVLNNLNDHFKKHPVTDHDITADQAMRIACYAIEQSNVVNLVPVVPVEPTCPKVTTLTMDVGEDPDDITQMSLIANVVEVDVTRRVSEAQIPLSTADYGDHICDDTQVLQQAGLEIAIELEKQYLRTIDMLATTQLSTFELKTATKEQLVIEIITAAHRVARLSRRGVANVVVVPVSLLKTVISAMDAHHCEPAPPSDGLQYIGTLNNMKVLVNWDAKDDNILVGFVETRMGPAYKGPIVDGGIAFVPTMLAIPDGTKIHPTDGQHQYHLKNEFGTLIQKNAKSYYVKIFSK